jgi:hypothetical protein
MKEKQDDGLYLLNLGKTIPLYYSVLHLFIAFCPSEVSREWTRVSVHGPGPVGRYGHAVTMAGSKFIVFGGQVDGQFLNDVWSFDLNSRKLARSHFHYIAILIVCSPDKGSMGTFGTS